MKQFLATVCIAALMVASFYHFRNEGMNAKAEKAARARVDALILALPEGTDRVEVEAYLNERAMTHTWSEEERLLDILFEKVTTTWVSSKGIQINILFDDADKVKEVKVRDYYAGP